MTTEFSPTGTIQFATLFQGVNTTTIWKLEESGSQIDFESFRRIAQTAERGLFSHFFLAEGLRPRELNGEIYDLDVAGRPEATTVLAAMAAVTERLGLVATQNTTYTDPVELARRMQTLDLLSEGRAAWNVVTTDNAWTGENFRRGGYLDREDRYTHALESLRIARALQAGQPVNVDGGYFSVRAEPTLPASPQGGPVIFQAGVSPQGKDFVSQHGDVVFSPFGDHPRALELRQDITARARSFGRDPNELKIFPAAEFIIADTEAEAPEKLAWVRCLQVGPEQTIAYFEQYWGTDLSHYDPDGPLPEIDPVVEETGVTRGVAFTGGGSAVELARQWRQEAEEKGQSMRDFATEKLQGRGQTFSGTASSIADELAEYARSGAVSGFHVVPWLIPSGLDDVVDHLVPVLQDRGIYPTEYAGKTLRENLGLAPVPAN
ncbi:F420-dependent methylene-tetrahydromethanopterin reductase [Corynebacterium yudongzhengii]|uniref:LLM class flavin-dependent oxidoreductase n=1 Tax=Corynebacterium yudongzhengii TaxID=2080740 RepID=A0A2U1T5Z7_9CORY|nr:LLM class flavin-dependent oxidoreductase [Corynebacterium yudongzhengii]AWB81965.1 F420-dependent methylene-tetrahydromethanopterin reductase [Corynebacterium yudongzhengii]PWC01426.1 LLM class flavin-dependent oxidoreductase [Corynebacterium yudongzhengii]